MVSSDVDLTVADAANQNPEPRSRPPKPTVVELLHPLVDQGRFSAHLTVGETATFVADAFTSGSDAVDVQIEISFDRQEAVVLRAKRPLDDDRWIATWTPTEFGPAAWRARAWLDPWQSWRNAAMRRLEAGVLCQIDIDDGAELCRGIRRRVRNGTGAAELRAQLGRIHGLLLLGDVDDVLADDELGEQLSGWLSTNRRASLTPSAPLWIARERAGHGSWYEFFPRSVGPDGTLMDAAHELPRIADMGFDVVYLPPVSPIGFTGRKGANNSVTSAPGEPGSPWAIGGDTGGHDAVHPDLGDIDDFVEFVSRADQCGLEIALDLAFQCSPDHPWIQQHPEWFMARSDGTLRTAENPPKIYEDIRPFWFDSPAWQDLWRALLDVTLTWIGRGVHIFRVDNPHTKPFEFWEWLISEVRQRHPEVIFLAEAFTRPRVMERLAKVGFDQSYGYFTWRRSAHELRSYFAEVHDRTADFMRVNVWPNTPDILSEQLRHAPRQVFEARAVLAATLSANWGIYGPAFEHCDNEPSGDGDEYLKSEKYQTRDWNGQEHRHNDISGLVARLNSIRRDHRALQNDVSLMFHHCDDDNILCFSKQSIDGDLVLVVVNTEADRIRWGSIHLDYGALGISPEADLELYDELSGDTFHWNGAGGWVQLNPEVQVAHVMSIVGNRVSDEESGVRHGG